MLTTGQVVGCDKAQGGQPLSNSGKSHMVEWVIVPLLSTSWQVVHKTFNRPGTSFPNGIIMSALWGSTQILMGKTFVQDDVSDIPRITDRRETQSGGFSSSSVGLNLPTPGRCRLSCKTTWFINCSKDVKSNSISLKAERFGFPPKKSWIHSHTNK